MTKKILIVLIFAVFVSINTDNTFAAAPCVDPIPPQDKVECAFGKITAPSPIAGFLEKNPTGSGAISEFLSRAVVLIFSIAAIVLIFMLLWGAFEWMTSAGDKEAIGKARSRIINALIGILLFAVAFAVIQVLGVFTGFTFFKEQNFTVIQRDSVTGEIQTVKCFNGKIVAYGKDFFAECAKP